MYSVGLHLLSLVYVICHIFSISRWSVFIYLSVCLFSIVPSYPLSSYLFLRSFLSYFIYFISSYAPLFVSLLFFFLFLYLLLGVSCFYLFFGFIFFISLYLFIFFSALPIVHCVRSSLSIYTFLGCFGICWHFLSCIYLGYLFCIAAKIPRYSFLSCFILFYLFFFTFFFFILFYLFYFYYFYSEVCSDVCEVVDCEFLLSLRRLLSVIISYSPFFMFFNLLFSYYYLVGIMVGIISFSIILFLS